MRTTAEISTDARDLIDSSTTKFVPPSIVRIGELSIEFMEAAAAELAELRDRIPSRDELAALQLAFAEVRAELAALKAAAAPAPADATPTA